MIMDGKEFRKENIPDRLRRRKQLLPTIILEFDLWDQAADEDHEHRQQEKRASACHPYRNAAPREGFASRG